MRKKHAFSRNGILVLFTLLLAGSLSGCGISLPPFELTLAILDDFKIEAVDLPFDIPQQDYELTLGESCSIPNMDELMALAEQYAGFFANFVTIEEVQIKNMVFDASQGDFNMLTKLSLILSTEALGDIDMGTVNNPAGLGSTITLAPENPVNLVNVLESLQSGECVKFKVIVSGSAPDQEVIFDLTSEVRIVISLG